MNVVIVGYGRMGRLIEEVLHERGHRVKCRVDNAGSGDESTVNHGVLDGADGVIEFALAEGMKERIEIYAASGLPVVTGTTGWHDLETTAKTLYSNSEGAFLRGTNFSLGAHIFFRLTAMAAKLLNNAEEYDVALTEYHHRAKADYPSGTALTAAEGILAGLDRKKRVLTDLSDTPIPHDALQVAAVRVGSVPGIHELRMDSPFDSLVIRHEARDRRGFALGAVRGLEWLDGRTGWYEADEFINDVLSEQR